MKKKIFCAVMCCVALTLGLICGISLPGKTAAAAEQSVTVPAPQFDADNVALTFSVMSDSHMGFGEEAETMLRNALNKASLRRYAKNGLDALVFCGDQTYMGKREEAELFANVLRGKFDLTKTAAVIAHGNHDTCWSGCMTRAEYVDAYGEDVYSFDQSDTDPATGNRHVLVKGYHFLAVEINYYSGKDNTNPMSPATEQWLKDTLDKLTAENPDQYIFVACHCPAPDTVYGSYAYNTDGTWGSSKELNAILKDYKQVVLFSGHTHYAINDERTINQSTYTQVHAGSTTDMVIDSDYLEKITDRRSESNGMVVEIDNKGRVRINRIDFARNMQIKNYWYLDACKADGSHLNRYTPEARAATNTAPDFGSDAALTLEAMSNNRVMITYPTAADDDMVFNYIITITNEKGEKVDEVNTYSPWYFDPDLSQLPAYRKITRTCGPQPVKVEVTAYDSFGAASKTLTATLGEFKTDDGNNNGDGENNNGSGDKKSGCGSYAATASILGALIALAVCAGVVLVKRIKQSQKGE